MDDKDVLVKAFLILLYTRYMEAKRDGTLQGWEPWAIDAALSAPRRVSPDQVNPVIDRAIELCKE